jgi:hypothetical protein
MASALGSESWAGSLRVPDLKYLSTVQLFYPSFAIKDPEEKIKARQVIVEGPLKEKLTLLSKLLVSV